MSNSENDSQWLLAMDGIVKIGREITAKANEVRSASVTVARKSDLDKANRAYTQLEHILHGLKVPKPAGKRRTAAPVVAMPARKKRWFEW